MSPVLPQPLLLLCRSQALLTSRGQQRSTARRELPLHSPTAGPGKGQEGSAHRFRAHGGIALLLAPLSQEAHTGQPRVQVSVPTAEACTQQ